MEETCIAQACDGTTNNQCCRIGSSTTYCRADLKDNERAHVDDFRVDEGIDLAHEQRECTGGEQICRTVPADISKRVELVGNAWYCDTDDETVESDEEEDEEQARYDNEGFARWRVGWFG